MSDDPHDRAEGTSSISRVRQRNRESIRKVSSPTALVNIGQLVTMRGPARPRVGRELTEPGVIPEGGILIRADRVEYVGSSGDVTREAKRSAAQIVDVGGRVVIPGLIDAHAHPVFGGDRLDEFEQRAAGASYEEIAARGGGIRATVAKTRAASEEQLLAQARKHARWFLQNGTTTTEAKSGYGLSLDAELKMLRVIRALNEESPLTFVPTFLGAHAVPDEFRGRRDDYAELIINEMLPAVTKEHLAEYADAFCEPAYFDVPTVRRVFSRAKQLGLKLRLHADQLTENGGAALAAELGARTADHLEQTGDEGIRALAQASVQPVLLPGSVYALGKQRYPAARQMIEAGLALVLATDFNPGSSPVPSIPMVLSLAVTQMKMSPAEALAAVTINAAYSLDRGDLIGSLEQGKRADLAVCDCGDYRELAYYIGAPLVHSVYAAGRCVYQRSTVN